MTQRFLWTVTQIYTKQKNISNTLRCGSFTALLRTSWTAFSKKKIVILRSYYFSPQLIHHLYYTLRSSSSFNIFSASMSDTGISSEATSFWVLFNLECDNQNYEKNSCCLFSGKKIIWGIFLWKTIFKVFRACAILR